MEAVDWLPLSRPCGFAEDAAWIPEPWHAWDMRLAAAPLGDGNKALLLGRVGGPEFRPSEVARIGYLTGIVSTLLGTSR